MSSRRILLSLCLAVACIGSAHAAERAIRNLHFVERPGDGPPVVFIHGFAQSTVYWQDWVDQLGARGIHAIAVDLPGFGGSASQPGPYTLESLADAVAGFIEQRKLGAVTLVGNSMGSTVAQFVTLRHPALVRRLVLTATSSAAPAPPPNLAQLKPEETRRYWATRDIPEMVNGFFFAKSPPAGYADRFYAAARQMSVNAAIEANASNQSWQTLRRLGEIKVPTLIIQGQHDQGKSPQEGELMVVRMPDARLVVLENAAHTPPWDEPDAFRAAAMPFILSTSKQ